MLTVWNLQTFPPGGPEKCANCGLRLVNTWFGDFLAPLTFVGVVGLAELVYDTNLLNTSPFLSILGLIFALAFVRHVFTSPRPYKG